MRLRFRTKRQKFGFALVIALVGLGLAYLLGVFDKNNNNSFQSGPEKFYSQLTGNEVLKDESTRPILAIMIENSPEARPQTGLDGAGIVFETVTEGGITRYLALYQENMPVEVGPVRSVRPAYVSWFSGFDASVAHVGGSEEGLNLVDELGAKSLNQFKYPDQYYRNKQRVSPHNVYTKTEDLRKLQDKLNHKQSKFDEIQRTQPTQSETFTAQSIKINFSDPLYSVEFKFDKQNNNYLRFLASKPHIDRETNQQISVKNIVVLKLTGNDSNSLQTIGEGEAFVFKDGNVFEAKWKKTAEDKMIELVDEQGNKIGLNRGDSWFSALPTAGSVKY